MDKLDKRTEILLALQCTEELPCRKRSAVAEGFDDVSVLRSRSSKGLLQKLIGENNCVQFYDNLDRIESIADSLRAADIHWICYDEPEYSHMLANIEEFPPVLFVKGNAALLNTETLAVVGTRRPTRYGIKVADAFVREFTRAKLTIASGFARGIDGVAHKVCVENESPTIAVFACGLDVCYPAEHKGLYERILGTGGLLVSEHAPGVRPLQFRFPERNRIISGLSRGVFLPEAALKSGSLITLGLAVDQGRELFIVPGNINSPESEGCNAMIKNYPEAFVTDPSDVLTALGITFETPEKATVELSITENAIAEALHDRELHFEELLEITGLNAGELATTLINLELNGVVEQTGGNFYALS